MGRAFLGDVRVLLVTAPLGPKDAVVVIAGPLRDMRGTIIRQASWGWSASVPNYVVEVKGLERVLRSDFLERAT